MLSSPSISSFCSFYLTPEILDLSAFYLQLCQALALSASNTCASSYITHALLLSVSTLSIFTPKIPVCWSTGGSSSRLLLILLILLLCRLLCRLLLILLLCRLLCRLRLRLRLLCLLGSSADVAPMPR